MKRTTVYLSEEELDGLRRRAAETGQSQAELIREGVRRVTAGKRRRSFASRAVGQGTGDPVARDFDRYLSGSFKPRR
jgi:Arc/MetJ-type ribon-helix-helix transcriptional regulator